VRQQLTLLRLGGVGAEGLDAEEVALVARLAVVVREPLVRVGPRLEDVRQAVADVASGADDV
jgi:hypothetical protein